MTDNRRILAIPRVVKATRGSLEGFTREQLRAYAVCIGVPRGRGKSETIGYLLMSRKATICATLGD